MNTKLALALVGSLTLGATQAQAFVDTRTPIGSAGKATVTTFEDGEINVILEVGNGETDVAYDSVLSVQHITVNGYPLVKITAKRGANTGILEFHTDNTMGALCAGYAASALASQEPFWAVGTGVQESGFYALANLSECGW